MPTISVLFTAGILLALIEAALLSEFDPSAVRDI
jgi:hypothetical protein